jgi:alpha-1,3-mannosyltransferase
MISERKNKKIRILHTARNYLPTSGGVQECIYQITRRLIDRCYSCKVLTLDYDFSNRKRKFKRSENIEGTDIYRIPGIGHYKKPIPLRVPIHLFEWADIIHIHDLRIFFETVILLRPFLKYKTILSTHGLVMHTNEMKIIKKILFPLYYRPAIRKNMDGVICDSNNDFALLNDKNSSNMYLIENGIDYRFYSNIKKDIKYRKFLYFGRIDTNKGIDLLIEVLSKLESDNWSIDIVGRGRSNIVKELTKLAEKSGIKNRVDLCGFLEKELLAKKLSEAEVCFFPSTYEGFGLSLLEAMASGTVCIANDIPAYRTFVKNKVNGFIIDFKNMKKAAEDIKEILKTSPDVLEKISKNASNTALKYDWENKIRLYDRVYKNIMGYS